MPKAKRISAAALAAHQSRHAPLGQVIQEDLHRGKYAKTIKGKNRSRDDDDGEELLDEKTSRRILELSREQQQEIDREEIQEQERRRRNQQKRSRTEAKGSDEEEEEEEMIALGDGDDDDDDDYIEHSNGYVSIVENTEGLTAEEEAIVAKMMGREREDANDEPQRVTLADLILQKIHEQEQAQEEEGEELPQLPPKVVEVYTDIGKILSRYTSGKLPKAFKVIPSLANWEDVLYLTRPDLWTPQAMFAATRIFASNLNPKMAQRFYALVLLDAVRTDIFHNKKLNYHYYMALKKSVYKPAAFFKGILLPLVKDNCTLREAAIVASVLQRVSIPVHHAAVAIHKLAMQNEYSGAASIFIKTLLNKKYSLPRPVISSLIQHFESFVGDKRELPVLWHQSLLVFLQRYKNEIQNNTKGLRIVMKQHFHPKITPECRRELFGAQAWQDERSMATSGGDRMVM